MALYGGGIMPDLISKLSADLQGIFLVNYRMSDLGVDAAKFLSPSNRHFREIVIRRIFLCTLLGSVMWAVARWSKGVSVIQDYVTIVVLIGICVLIYFGHRLMYVISSGIMLTIALAIYFKDEALLSISAVVSIIFFLDILAMWRGR
jgi:hypothetical protein